MGEGGGLGGEFVRCICVSSSTVSSVLFLIIVFAVSDARSATSFGTYFIARFTVPVK